MLSPRSRLAAVPCLVALLLAGCGSQISPDVEPGSGTVPEVAATSDPSDEHGCPPPDAGGDSIIDWVEFVQVDGVLLEKVWPETEVDESGLGATIGEVTCRISDRVGDASYEIRDGDAAFLDEGAELRAMTGYRQDFRVAAAEGKHWLVYESRTVDGAATGADQLDIAGKVVAIHQVEGYYGRDIEATIDDPAQVAAVVQAVLASPVIAEDELDESMYDEELLFVRFDLVDGTSVQRAWRVRAGVIGNDLRAPAELTEALAL